MVSEMKVVNFDKVTMYSRMFQVELPWFNALSDFTSRLLTVFCNQIVCDNHSRIHVYYNLC